MEKEGGLICKGSSRIGSRYSEREKERHRLELLVRKRDRDRVGVMRGGDRGIGKEGTVGGSKGE